MVVAWSNDPESYTGGSVYTGRASYARRVKGYDTDKKGYPGPPGGELVVRLTSPPQTLLRNLHNRLKESQNPRRVVEQMMMMMMMMRRRRRRRRNGNLQQLRGLLACFPLTVF